MSKIEAYFCDYKDHLVPDKEAVGISPTEDLFDKMASFPTVFNPKKAEIHYCTGCYRTFVLTPASNLVNRRLIGEEPYKLKVKELAYGLRAETVRKYRERKRFS
jgi:hypothetical protein